MLSIGRRAQIQIGTDLRKEAHMCEKLRVCVLDRMEQGWLQIVVPGIQMARPVHFLLALLVSRDTEGEKI